MLDRLFSTLHGENYVDALFSLTNRATYLNSELVRAVLENGQPFNRACCSVEVSFFVEFTA